MTSYIGERVRFHSLVLVVWCLFLIAGLAIVDDYGASWETVGHRLVANNTLNYVLHDDQTLLQIGADRFYGAAFAVPLLLLTERALGLEDPRQVYLARHVLTHLFFLLGGFCCYLLALRLSGDRLIALLVMLLFLLSPRLYAHSFFNSKDPVFASAFVMALLFASRAFDKDSVGAYRQCGAAAGLLVNLRIMGAVLVAVVLVFRVWAWFRAKGRERQRVAATTGVFALWGVVVLFITLPYLWGDPVERLAEYWMALANHPHIAFELFRGEMFFVTALPWDYALHWFVISQPPVTLLLGLSGLVALGLAAVGVVRRGVGAGPGRGLGGAELRFGVLLATCFALPMVAFVLLRPNTYEGWRHFYFLHGPFCLLATFVLMGARQLAARGLRKEWVGGAICALTAAGLGGVALEMAQIHPHQYLYFNFLADRKTPERLRTRYTMDYFLMATRQSYEYMLRQTPAGAINIKRKYLDTTSHNMILPAADRRRFTHDLSRDPDFYLRDPDFYLAGRDPDFYLRDPDFYSTGRGVDLWLSHQPKTPFPPVLHRIKVYNNTIMTVAAPDLSRVDPAVAAAYRALHRAATAEAPAARGGGFEVYLHGGRLAWVKEACEPEALMREFRLDLYPADAGRLPDYHRKRGYFELIARGVRFDGKCLGMARLPDFALARARLSQPGRWEVEVPL